MEKEKNALKQINKLSLPATILIASIILGGFYYFTQTTKQKSIEKQQQIDKGQQDLLSKQKECELLSKGVMQKWYNVMGVTYDTFWGECVVTYTDTKTGEVKTTPLSSMQTEK
jgi:hypothetical protein